MKNDSNGHLNHKPSSLRSRLQTAAVCVPILIIMINYKFLNLLLLLVVIFVSHHEFRTMQRNILHEAISDQYGEITHDILLSSPLDTYIFMLTPVIMYYMENSNIIASVTVLSLLVMYRLNCFIYIHKLINSSEFEILHHHSTSKGITLRSPIQKLIEAKGKENSNESKEVTQTKSQSKTNTSTTNVNLHQMISQKMFISCLVAITIDFIYFFVYAFPLCYSLYIHQLGNSGFILFNIILIAYQCDNGALFIGNTLGRTPFGHPITPTKTVEGVIGGVFFGYMTGYVTRQIVINYTKIPMLNGFYFFLFCSVIIFAAIFGDFFESFLKRCANSKDSGKLLPGHGGLMDRIDSLSLCFPLGYYFLTNFI